MPDSADTIVIQEDVPGARESRILLSMTVPTGDNGGPAGMDFHAGDTLVPAGRRLGPRDVALRAAANHTGLTVRRRGQVAILATGDELVAPGGRTGAGADRRIRQFHAIRQDRRYCQSIAIDLGIAVDEAGTQRGPLLPMRATPKPMCWLRSAAHRSTI